MKTVQRQIKTTCLALASSSVLAACMGGGGGGSDTSNPTSAEIVRTGDLEAASVSFENGMAVPTRMTVDGVSSPVLQAVANSNIYSDGTNVFRVASGSDGVSYAIVGMSFTGEHLGSYLSGATAAPTTGSVNHTGSYNAELNGPFTSQFYSVTGDARVTANFSTGTAVVAITNRETDFDVSGYDNAQLEESLAFLGTVDADGVIRGTQTGGDSVGATVGLVFQDGAVGTVTMEHRGAATGNRAVFENGVFAAD
ncbi:hypothetical protein [Yoonia sp. 2307UL14-13]|uniref:hypothetical protein n=1 Tax=Yoonia sp. 2307UL14-13 TaxID=3126506 RepID=UPI0030AC614E